MKALRRVTHADLRESNLIYQLCMQTKQACKAGEIDEETSRQLLNVLYRCHTHVCIRSGVIDRVRQRRFNARSKRMDPSKQFDLIIAGTLLALVAAWIWVL